ncbi:hypothetical protein [Flammeovirga sp. EKP202]|uniref:nSTAND1 domain-containing NTPase n=1 Tax=Flammeovirga sp. EKP202 TaxID=2770592 RepID=UPI00165FFDD6|nr:hypothetical protein [Flammeovirga sp. EKP202]MBD0405041.1 hypothetical protein [Flammeovirga sp. EKP202]
MKTSTIELTRLENPFLGLHPFSVEEAHLYYGREKHAEHVVSQLIEHRFSAILGESGTGKSSFVFSSVLPTLECKINPITYIFSPGTHGPLKKLINEVFKKENDEVRLAIFQSLLIDVTSFFEYYYRLNISKTPVMYIDQFEELFTYDLQFNAMDLEIAKFVELIVLLSTSPLSDFHIIITMHSDFIEHCADYPTLTYRLNQSQFLIPKMTKEEVVTTITKPLEWSGVKITDELLQFLIVNLDYSQNQLPLLQHAMMRTFEHWRNNQKLSEPLQLEHYFAVGGINESLPNHAQEIFDGLEDNQKEVSEKIFRSIITVNEEGEIVSNPCSLYRLIEISGIDDIRQIIEVIDIFRQRENAILSPLDNSTIYETSVIGIAHESLINSWPLLKEWTQKEKESIQTYLKLAKTAEKFQNRKGSRLKEYELQSFIKWKEEQQPTYDWGVKYHPSYERTMEFLSFSEKVENRIQERMKRNMNKRIHTTKICVVSFLLFGSALTALYFYQNTTSAAPPEKTEVLRTYERTEPLIIPREDHIKIQRATIIARMQKKRSLTAMRKKSQSAKKAREYTETISFAEQNNKED